jgi:hypothetical protein
MVALYDHIQMLRAELAANTCPLERDRIEEELQAAEIAHAAEVREFAAAFESG